MRDLKSLLDKRQPDYEQVGQHKARMLQEVRAQRLRELRERADLTQVEVASVLHVSQNRVSRIERGEIERSQLDTLRKYVEAIGGKLHVEAEFDGERIPIG